MAFQNLVFDSMIQINKNTIFKSNNEICYYCAFYVTYVIKENVFFQVLFKHQRLPLSWVFPLRVSTTRKLRKVRQDQAGSSGP